MSSCTTALHLALVVLGWGRRRGAGGGLHLPRHGHVVVQLGAKPILVDIDLDTFTMNTEDCAGR